MKKVLTAVTYCGLGLATAASSYFDGLGKAGFHSMDNYDWLKFTLLMVIALFTVMRSLCNGTFSNGNGTK